MVRVARLSICDMRRSPKRRHMDLWLLGNSNWNLHFTIQNLPSICNRKYGSATLDVSGLALNPFTRKRGSWPSEWTSGNGHQSRHSTGTACFVMYIVCIVVCTASLKEKENARTVKTSEESRQRSSFSGGEVVLRRTRLQVGP